MSSRIVGKIVYLSSFLDMIWKYVFLLITHLNYIFLVKLFKLPSQLLNAPFLSITWI